MQKGEQEWLASALLDNDKCHTIIKSYKDHRKQILAGAKLPEKWPLLEVKAMFFKRSATDINAEGEMMNRRRFLQWAQDLVIMCICIVIDAIDFVGLLCGWR